MNKYLSTFSLLKVTLEIVTDWEDNFITEYPQCYH